MIAIIDYGMGNIQSIKNALELLNAKVLVTQNPSDLEKANGIILPGVGAFGDGMKNLKSSSMVEALHQEVIVKGKPFLGICLGMQFIAKTSFEHGMHEGLGWIDAEVKIIKPEELQFKVPHMGWSDVTLVQESPLFIGLGEKETFYFVHSYAVVPNEDENIVTASCWHGTKIAAGIQKDNIFAVQFHPEKSQGAGIKVLENFLKIISERK